MLQQAKTIWSSSTLRNRVAALLCALLVALLTATLVGLWIASAEDFAAERAPFERQSAQIATSLNAILNASSEPDRIIDALVASLANSNGTIRFTSERPTMQQNEVTSLVPDWFLELLPVHDHQPRSYTIQINDRTLGYLTFVQDMFPDIMEKWITFIVVVSLFLIFGIGSFFIVYLGVGTMLRPLEAVANGLTRIGVNELPDIRATDGPPEIRRLAHKVNEIGQTLQSLRRENVQLLRSVVTAQDRERDEISRDLHDELGPLLFALRAGVISMQNISSVSNCRVRAVEMEQSIETLQGVHRQLLDRLRPLELTEIGLVRSIQAVIDRAMALDDNLKIDANIDPRIDAVDPPVARTILRVVQESVLNVQRHSGAGKAVVSLQVVPDEAQRADMVRVVVTDDGKGIPVNFKPGRGLSGIEERARALGGHFEISGKKFGTRIDCTLPIRAD